MERNRGLQYKRAEEELREMISDMENSNISLLPTESELSKQLNVGRNTFRRVIGDLVKEGIVERIQGKGTFIVQKQRKITFSGWVSKDPGGDIVIDRMITNFEQHHKLRVEYLSLPFYQYPNQLLRLCSQGKAPDVVQMNPYWLPRFQRLDLLLTLDNRISRQNLNRRYSMDLESCRIDGHMYALNWCLCPLILYYNKRVLDRVGLDPDKPPKTLEELEELSIKVNQSGADNIYGFCLPLAPNEPHFHWLLPFLLAFNGGYSDTIGNLIIDSEENIRAMHWLIHFYEKGGHLEPKRQSDARILFATDHLAFLIDGPYARGFFRQISHKGINFDSQYGVVTVPVGPSGKSESALLTHSLAIPRQCTNLDLAREWIEYLTVDEENARLYFEQYGMIPCLRDLLHKPFYLSDPFASVLIQQIDTASLVPIQHPLFAKSLPFLMQVFSRMIRFQQKPEERLKFLREIISMIGQADEFASSIL